MVSPGENENPMEDIEEGEIADASDEGLNDDNDDDSLPGLQRKASLNDLAASRYWNDVGRREEGQRFVDQGQSGTAQWRREGLQFSSSNGNYNPSLYLAWAKAVQSKPTFPAENSNTNNNNYGNNSKSKEENVKNGRGSMKLRELGFENPNASGRRTHARRNDDHGSSSGSSSASGSSSSDGSDREVASKDRGDVGNVLNEALGKVGMGGSCDNDEKLEVPVGGGSGVDDEREEGELEEGEIEMEMGSGYLESSSSSPERFENPGDEGRPESDLPSGQSLMPGMHLDRCAGRQEIKHSIGSAKGLGGKQGLNDQGRGKEFADIAEMLMNVSVKDAQKSFMGVCDKLHKALRSLIEISSKADASIISTVFAGIQAAYAVYKTGSPKKQEEKSAFPRLLEFVETEARKLFTNKQMKELQSMLLSVSFGNQSAKFEIAHEEKLRSTFKPEGRERISPNNEIRIDADSLKSIDSLNNADEVTYKLKTSEANYDTQVLTLTDNDSRASSNSSLSAGAAEFSDLSPDKPWEDNEPDGSNLLTPTREDSPACWNQQNLRSSFVGNQPSVNSLIPPARITNDETDERGGSEAVHAAITSYQEKFSIYDRMPSPTPSEDNEEEETSCQGVEASTSDVNTKPQSTIEEREMRDTNNDENASFWREGCCYPLNLDTGSMEPGNQNGSLIKVIIPVSQKDIPGEIETTKSTNFTGGHSRKALSKSRDPRRRATESEFHTVDLNRQPCQVESNVITKDQVEGTLLFRKHKADDDLMQEIHYAKRQRHHSANNFFPNNFPVMVSGSGGWLEESTVIPSSSDWDQTFEMEADGTGVLPRLNEFGNDSDTISNTDREHTFMENGNLNKRQKTESFYHGNTSTMGPALEVSQVQSNSIGANLNLKMISQGEEESGERNVSDTTDISQQIHAPVTSTSDLIPTVLKGIAVNPTMLMNLLKCGQESFSSQGIQNIEQYQQANSTTASIGAFIPTEVNPSISKLSSLQQQVLQDLATAPKPATQIASTGAESRKLRMKPRDPRRVLPINSGLESLKLNGTSKCCTPVSREPHTTSSRPAAADVVPKLPQVLSLPNIEQNFKEKLMSIAQLLGKSDMKKFQALSSQLRVDQPNRQIELLGLDSTSGMSSKFHEVDKQDMTVTKDSTIDSSSPLQSLTDENIADAQHQPNPWGDLDHLLEGYSEEQRLAIHQERARRIEEQNKMFRAKKLCLVLDLDHTLLNSAKFVEVEHMHDEILRKKEEQDKERAQRQLFRFPHMGMWTKLRPGIWNFLDRASKLYELHVYTMGNKVYATEMAKVLDPTGTLFAGRVISKGDEADIDGDDRLPKSKDLDGVLGMESAVVIIDDSARVWPHHRHNLIVVERYMYFPCSRRQFGLPGPSLLEADLDERPEDGTLASSLAVIEKIHHNFFSSKLLHQVDVRDILAAEQRKILMGCKVVFSRVFPVGEAQPHLHPLWQMAEQFGAVCSTHLDDQVTHVVAVAPGTDKVNWARENNRFVVHPGWIEASALLYRRANERDYTIVTNYPCPIH